VAGGHARLARQALAIAKIPHGVLQPGVADEFGVRRKGLEPGAEQRLVATGDPEARPAARTVAPQLIRACGAAASACRSSQGSSTAPSGTVSPPTWGAPRRRGVGVKLDAPSPVDYATEVEQQVRHAGVAGEAVRRHRREAIEGEVVRRLEPDVEHADSGPAS
jgi:hypothetical protein